MGADKAVKSEKYASKFGAIMSMTGMAIGLGNVWRFPYMVGQYGGGAFVLAYLICVVVIVAPLAIMEAGYGKGLGKGMMEAYETALGKPVLGKILGGFCSCVYGAMNFFFIPIMGTCLYFIYVCATSKWKTVEPDKIYSMSQDNTVLMVGITVALALIVGFIIYRGVQSGIEAISKFMIPLMFVFFILVILFAAFTIDGIGKGYDWYLKPDFSQLAKPSLWVAAVGQALFSIGVGPGCVLIYGSHIPKNDDVTVSLTAVCLLDTAIAVIAGMALIPSCIALGLDPESGSGLIFIVLPTLLSRIPLGNVVGVLVFVAIFCAAITTSIAEMETPVATFKNGLGISREKTTIVAMLITLVVAAISASNESITAFWSATAGDYGFIVTAGLGAVVFGWVYGVDKIRTRFVNPSSGIQLGKWYTNWCKYIAIPVLLVIMLNSLFPFLG